MSDTIKMPNGWPLSEILDEIESGFSSVRICKPPCCDCEIVLQGLTLVKALRRAIEAIRILGDNETVIIRSDISPRIELEQITAILNQKQKENDTK